MDENKRAEYDDELLMKTENIYVLKIWKFRINVIYVFGFSLMFFASKYLIDYYKNIMMYYNCPLGEEKFSVDNLKYNEKTLNLIDFIETTKEDIIKENTHKIAEDDEYEYYTEDE
mgnify:FL=1